MEETKGTNQKVFTYLKHICQGKSVLTERVENDIITNEKIIMKLADFEDKTDIAVNSKLNRSLFSEESQIKHGVTTIVSSKEI